MSPRLERSASRVKCPKCGKNVAIGRDGKLWRHRQPDCVGAGFHGIGGVCPASWKKKEEL